MDQFTEHNIKQSVFAGLTQLATEADAVLDMVEIAGEKLTRKIMRDTFIKKDPSLIAGSILREIIENGN